MNGLRDRGVRIQLGAFALIGILSIVLGFLAPADLRIAIYRHAAFWLVFAAFVLLAHALYAARGRLFSRSDQPTTLFQTGDLPWLVAFTLATTIMFLAVPPAMRVQMDEANLVGTSLSFYATQTATYPLSGMFHFDGLFDASQDWIDKRGLALPFLANVLHVATGYRMENVFAVNFAATVGLLFLLYKLLRFVLPRAFAGAGSLLLLSFPVFAITATSAGFEPANLCVLLLACWLAVAATRTGDPRLLPCLLFLLPIASELRYESNLAVVLFLAWAGWLWLRDGAARMPWQVLLLPILFLPLATRWAVPHDYEVAVLGLDRPFTLGYFTANIARAAQFLLAPSRMMGGSPLVGIIAVLALIPVVLRTVRGSQEPNPARRPVMAAMLVFAAITVIVLAYAWGDFTFAPTARLSLTLMVPLCALAAWGVCRSAQALRLGPAPVIAGAAALAFVALGLVRSHPAMGAIRSSAILAYSDTVLRRDFGSCRVLVVSQMPQYFLVNKYSAMSFNELERSREWVADFVAQGFFDTIVAVEAVAPRFQPSDSPPQIFTSGESALAFERRRLNHGTWLTLSIVSLAGGEPSWPSCATRRAPTPGDFTPLPPQLGDEG